MFSEIDLQTRAIKSKHDTGTKKAGIAFYNSEAKEVIP